jgi:hypothetical protein
MNKQILLDLDSAKWAGQNTITLPIGDVQGLFDELIALRHERIHSYRGEELLCGFVKAAQYLAMKRRDIHSCKIIPYKHGPYSVPVFFHRTVDPELLKE